MAGPKYNYFTIRDELDMQTSGHLKGAASISGTAGKITTFNATTGTITTLGTTTLTPTTVNATTLNVAGTTTLSGDLVRNTAKYMSGATGKVASGYTRCPAYTEIIDEGVAILSGISGNIYPKLAASPTVGKTLSLVYINSGAASTYQAKCSGNFKISKSDGAVATQYYATFRYPGDALTITSDGTYWYPTHPASGATIAGPNWSTT